MTRKDAEVSDKKFLRTPLRWSGLLVEPNPAAFQKLKLKHRKAHTSPACLSPLPRLGSMMLALPANIHSNFDCENNDCLDFFEWHGYHSGLTGQYIKVIKT